MILPYGVLIKPLTKHTDSRGFLTELFRKDELNFEGQNFDIQQGYFSITNPGVRRGPHQHEFQSDYFCFLNGSFLLELWDVRIITKDEINITNHINLNELYKLDSFNDIEKVKKDVLNSYWSCEVGEDNPCVVIVPPGVIHSYTNMGDTPAFTLNFPDKLYAGQNKKEVVDEIRYEENPLFKEI